MATSTAHWLDELAAVARPEELSRARAEEALGRSAADYLLSSKSLAANQLLPVLGRYYGVPWLPLRGFHAEPSVLSLITQEVARRFRVLPLFKIRSHLYLGVVDPLDVEAQDYVAQSTHFIVEPVLVSRDDLEEALNRHYLGVEQSAHEMGAIAPSVPREASAARSSPVEDLEAPVIKLVNYILAQAIRLGASDVHLEPFAKHCRLRYRVDGILHEFPSPPFHLFRSLVSRIKILSNLDIAEKRLPQDGRTTFRLDERDFDVRVSVIPNSFGEGVVLRILDPGGSVADLDSLGLSTSMMAQFDRLIHQPYGIILVTGPTGSGKSTTLYAVLRKIYTPRRKIITLEDPVEAHVDGVVQIQIHPDIGFTFANGLRHILRHDPDTIMLGEIRDPESAEIALRTSLTGHMLFSTLHTNDAPLAVTRLVDMGVPPFLVMSSLLAVLAQRLMRRLCKDCKKPHDLTAAEASAAGIRVPSGAVIYKPVGCSNCGHLGYRGRVGIYELLEITSEMRRLQPDELTPAHLLRHAKSGYFTMRDSAVQKLVAGVTSFEEVLSVTTGV